MKWTIPSHPSAPVHHRPLICLLVVGHNNKMTDMQCFENESMPFLPLGMQGDMKRIFGISYNICSYYCDDAEAPSCLPSTLTLKSISHKMKTSQTNNVFFLLLGLVPCFDSSGILLHSNHK